MAGMGIFGAVGAVASWMYGVYGMGDVSWASNKRERRLQSLFDQFQTLRNVLVLTENEEEV